MAKRPSRSQADDGTAPAGVGKPRARAKAPRELGPQAVANRAAGSIEPNSIASGPEKISERLEESRGQVAAGDEPSEEEIRARAYEMYLQRGGHHGLDFDDWLRAEEELRKRR